jgi:hypothetical protein
MAHCLFVVSFPPGRDDCRPEWPPSVNTTTEFPDADSGSGALPLHPYLALLEDQRAGALSTGSLEILLFGP